MIHVDVIRNDWPSGRQVVVAQAFVIEGELHVDPVEDDDKQYLEIVQRPIFDHSRGVEVLPTEDPERFFELLPEAMSGSYLFATEPHEQADCRMMRSIR